MQRARSFEERHQTASIFVIFTIQDKYKNVNILLNFSIPPVTRRTTSNTRAQFKKQEKSINGHFYWKRPYIDSFGFEQTCRNRSNADWHVNKQIDVFAIRFDYLENGKSWIYDSITIFSSFWLHFRRSRPWHEMLAYLLQSYPAKFSAQG